MRLATFPCSGAEEEVEEKVEWRIVHCQEFRLAAGDPGECAGAFALGSVFSNEEIFCWKGGTAGMLLRGLSSSCIPEGSILHP